MNIDTSFGEGGKENTMKNRLTDNTAEYADHVVCANCGVEMLVDVGEDVCPCCAGYGCLMWASGKPDEYAVFLTMDILQQCT